jgi:hypothetical protein
MEISDPAETLWKHATQKQISHLPATGNDTTAIHQDNRESRIY